MLWTRFRRWPAGWCWRSALRRRGGRRARQRRRYGQCRAVGRRGLHRPPPNSGTEYPVWYAQGCTGHDEPELDPVSSLAGSAQELTWTAVLPTDGAVPVSS